MYIMVIFGISLCGLQICTNGARRFLLGPGRRSVRQLFGISIENIFHSFYHENFWSEMLSFREKHVFFNVFLTLTRTRLHEILRRTI